MVKYKSEVKKAVIVLVLIIFCGSIAMIYSAPQQNYICQQNPNDPRCTSNNNNSGNSGGGGGGSGGSGACNDSDVQKFLKGEDPFPNPPGGSCPAKIRTYKARIEKCQTAKKCLSGQVNALKKEIEELEKKIAELEKDPKIKELQDLAKRESELKTCIANCQDRNKICEDYVKAHITDILNCGGNSSTFNWGSFNWDSKVCTDVCKICPPGKFGWCPPTCQNDHDCYGKCPDLGLGGVRAQCVSGICKCEQIPCRGKACMGGPGLPDVIPSKVVPGVIK